MQQGKIPECSRLRNVDVVLLDTWRARCFIRSVDFEF